MVLPQLGNLFPFKVPVAISLKRTSPFIGSVPPVGPVPFYLKCALVHPAELF